MNRGKTILQVEDDDNDVLFLRIALRKAGVDASVQVVPDGREAIDYLSGTGRYANRNEFPLPALVLLDLRLPRVPGHEVVRWIRQTPALQSLVVLVFSSSNSPTDRTRAYQAGANSYLVKPTNPSDLVELARLIANWLEGNQPPVETTLVNGSRAVGIEGFDESRHLPEPGPERT